MLVIIIMEESLNKLSAFIILTFDDNIRIIRIIVEHTDSIIRFMLADRGVLLGESKTEMIIIRTLNDIFEKIVFGIFVTFNILKNEVFINIFINKHIFLVRTVARKREQGIIA